MAVASDPPPAPVWLALARRLLRSRLLIAALLWLLALQVFSRAPVPGGRGASRVDHAGVEAYPLSDAGCDFQNALAILTGEGWVNWRGTNRWSVYKPGWGAALAVTALVTGRDTGRMQRLITAGLSLAAPAFFLLLLTLFPGPRGVPVAALATVFFVLNPSDQSWWFQRQMMTEGPTLLLALVFAILALRIGRRPPAADWHTFALGLTGGAAALVRGQARYAVAAAVAVMVLARIRRPRLAARFLALFACGFLVVVGPLYLKTSFHLKSLYTGTSYYALVTMLDWTEAGRAVGGSALAAEDREPEQRALEAMSRRAIEALRFNLRDPGRVVARGLRDVREVLFGAPAKIFDTRSGRPAFLYPMALLFALGVVAAARRHGLDALVPAAYAAGYLLPNLLYSYFLPRFGAPVGWVGLAFVSGSLLWWVNESRPGAADRLVPSLVEPPPQAVVPRAWLVPSAVWVVLAAALLLWVDLRPRPDVDVERLLASPKVLGVLANNGVELDDRLRAEIERAVNHDEPSPRVHVGIAHLPMMTRPRNSGLVHGWVILQPRPRPYTVFFSISPWKNDGSFELYTVSRQRWMYRGYRHGDRVVAILKPPAETTPVPTMFPQVEAAAVFPVRWADG